MQIVVLHDPSFDENQQARLRNLGTLALYNDTTSEELAMDRIENAQIVVVDSFKVPVSRTVIEAGQSLRLLVLTSTAYHLLDIAAATERGVKVANIPSYSTEAVAEHTIALMLAVVKAIPLADQAMRRRPFQIDPAIEEHRRYLGFELRGKTLGVVGLGAIGGRVAELGLCLGMRIVAFNRSPRRLAHVRLVPLAELLAESDVVSIHLAVHPETEHMISDRELRLMKSTAVLINSASGELVDTAALHRALRERRLAGAGLDVLERWDPANPLLSLSNVVLSPQSAAWTREASNTLAESIVKVIEAFACGQPVNIVNS
ncbi:MAG TPA: NAD(P)-dependent oxidoreductase [Alphaproteobacteria bacterium]|nr:NAD(P)-dependent oxidoreductase [Alphaproteobacteria bacterium]